MARSLAACSLACPYSVALNFGYIFRMTTLKRCAKPDSPEDRPHVPLSSRFLKLTGNPSPRGNPRLAEAQDRVPLRRPYFIMEIRQSSVTVNTTEAPIPDVGETSRYSQTKKRQSISPDAPILSPTGRACGYIPPERVGDGSPASSAGGATPGDGEAGSQLPPLRSIGNRRGASTPTVPSPDPDERRVGEGPPSSTSATAPPRPHSTLVATPKSSPAVGTSYRNRTQPRVVELHQGGFPSTVLASDPDERSLREKPPDSTSAADLPRPHPTLVATSGSPLATEEENHNLARSTPKDRRLPPLARSVGIPGQSEPTSEGKSSCPTSAPARLRPLSTSVAASPSPSATGARPQPEPQSRPDKSQANADHNPPTTPERDPTPAVEGAYSPTSPPTRSGEGVVPPPPEVDAEYKVAGCLNGAPGVWGWIWHPGGRTSSCPYAKSQHEMGCSCGDPPGYRWRFAPDDAWLLKLLELGRVDPDRMEARALELYALVATEMDRPGINMKVNKSTTSEKTPTSPWPGASSIEGEGLYLTYLVQRENALKGAHSAACAAVKWVKQSVQLFDGGEAAESSHSSSPASQEGSLIATVMRMETGGEEGGAIAPPPCSPSYSTDTAPSVEAMPTLDKGSRVESLINCASTNQNNDEYPLETNHVRQLPAANGLKNPSHDTMPWAEECAHL